jgi:hypothetical protein
LGDGIAYQVKMPDRLLSVTVNGASQSVNVFLSDPGAVVSFYHLSVNHSP